MVWKSPVDKPLGALLARSPRGATPRPSLNVRNLPRLTGKKPAHSYRAPYFIGFKPSMQRHLVPSNDPGRPAPRRQQAITARVNNHPCVGSVNPLRRVPSRAEMCPLTISQADAMSAPFSRAGSSLTDHRNRARGQAYEAFHFRSGQMVSPRIRRRTRPGCNALPLPFRE